MSCVQTLCQNGDKFLTICWVGCLKLQIIVVVVAIVIREGVIHVGKLLVHGVNELVEFCIRIRFTLVDEVVPLQHVVLAVTRANVCRAHVAGWNGQVRHSLDATPVADSNKVQVVAGGVAPGLVEVITSDFPCGKLDSLQA